MHVQSYFILRFLFKRGSYYYYLYYTNHVFGKYSQIKYSFYINFDWYTHYAYLHIFLVRSKYVYNLYITHLRKVKYNILKQLLWQPRVQRLIFFPYQIKVKCIIQNEGNILSTIYTTKIKILFSILNAACVFICAIFNRKILYFHEFNTLIQTRIQYVYKTHFEFK